MEELECGDETAHILEQVGELFLQVPAQRVVDGEDLGCLVDEAAFLGAERVQNALEVDETLLFCLCALIVVP